MQRWEYLFVYIVVDRVESVNGEGKQNILGQIFPGTAGMKGHELANQLGELGWELVGTLPSDHPASGQLIFKRPKP